MRWKDVFFIWLLADILLAAGLLFAMLKSSGQRNDLDIFPLVLGYGFLLTLPSLAAMLIFHGVYSNARKDGAYRFLPYLLLVLSINLIYFFVWKFVNRYHESFDDWLFLCTTAAGLIALAFVHWRIKKRKRQTIMEKV